VKLLLAGLVLLLAVAEAAVKTQTIRTRTTARP
jgi:hypothetical protein